MQIIRRMDLSGDGMLSFQEFTDFIRSQPKRPCHMPVQRCASPLRLNKPQEHNPQHHPHKCIDLAARASCAACFAFPCVCKACPNCSKISCRCLVPKARPILSLPDEDHLVNALLELLSLEKELEQGKVNLAQRPDFNMIDAFSIFDPCKRGSISSSELKDGLAAIGVYPT